MNHSWTTCQTYDLFLNKDEIEVDYLIMGPGLVPLNLSQAKANHLISLAKEKRLHGSHWTTQSKFGQCNQL